MSPHEGAPLQIWCSGLIAARRAASRQTPGLATLARNCDHIATMRRVTGGDVCPTGAGDIAVGQELWDE
jgi:hypothetical protein